MLDQIRNPYKELAQSLDALPNGFPFTNSGAELRLLEKLFSPEEAAIAARLSNSLETPKQIAERLKIEYNLELNGPELRKLLKNMAREGLIAAGRVEGGLGYRIMPFVVGIYEMQAGKIDHELARLFENYYQEAFDETLSIEPSFHRVIPVGKSVRMDMEIMPFESANDIVDSASAWGVIDCICRTQKKLIDDPCEHPVDVCMIFSQKPGAFDHSPQITAITQSQAHDTLQRSAEAGLVHNVSNSKDDLQYICNCCTCSCGILRGLAESGMANAVARSAFINVVDDDLCIGCETCIEFCQFDALSLHSITINVDERRCVGCGVCVPSCSEGALALIRRPEADILPIPINQAEWSKQRLAARR